MGSAYLYFQTGKQEGTKDREPGNNYEFSIKRDENELCYRILLGAVGSKNVNVSINIEDLKSMKRAIEVMLYLEGHLSGSVDQSRADGS